MPDFRILNEGVPGGLPEDSEVTNEGPPLEPVEDIEEVEIKKEGE
jgi:hypothetical protein